MAVPLEVLQSLASAFSAVRTGSQLVQPGTPVAVKLLPASAAGLTATDLVAGQLELTWITKDVRFNTFGIEPVLGTDPFVPADIDALLSGGMPAIVPAVVPLPALNNVGTQQLQGIPGQLAQLAGSFPIPVEVPVALGVLWEVLDENHAVIAAGGATYQAPDGTASPEATFVFPPQTVELTNDVSLPVVRRYLRATITLRAGAVQTTRALPEIPVDIPAIPLPAVAVFFLHRNFAAVDGDDEGAALVVVPNNSPLRDLAQLQGLLDTLESTVSSLAGIAEFASFLLGLGELTAALAAQPHVQFRVADGENKIRNFNDITLIQRSWYQNDTEAEDELSSMILVGPSEKRIQCFVARDCDTDEGAFDLTTGRGLFAMVRNLHGSDPATDPSGLLTVTRSAKTFGDELSSLRFG